MPGPFRIGRPLGIPLSVHPVTLLVWGLFAWSGLALEGAVLFASVLLHEGAHAWVARLRGLTVVGVEILPFGGAARMAPGVWSPADECAVAVAGPCVNLGLAALAFGAGRTGIGWLSDLLSWSCAANLLLAAFNLLPLLPLDGGRILRSALVGLRGWGVYETTQKLSHASRGLALLLGVVGLFGMWQGTLNVTWVVVALFLYQAASKEEEAAAVALLRRAAKPARRVRGSGVRSIRAFAVSPDTPVRAVAHLLRRGAGVILVVDDDGLVLGTLLEGDVWDGAARLGLTAVVARLLRD